MIAFAHIVENLSRPKIVSPLIGTRSRSRKSLVPAHRLSRAFSQIVLQWQTTRRSVFAEQTILEIDLGLSDDLVRGDQVPIFDTDDQIFGQRDDCFELE